MTVAGSVRSVPESSRYELVADGDVIGIAEYRAGPGYVVMHHTRTEPEHRGRGVAEQLVGAALDDLRARSLRVVPTCWYVAQFIDDHPTYRDLLYQDEI